MVALRSLVYEPAPEPGRPPHWQGEREVLADERERERDWRDSELENERPNYATEGGL